MNPILRELQRQLNDIAKQLDALQRQETLNTLPSNMAVYSGTPVAGNYAYWTGAGTVSDSGFGTAQLPRYSGTPTANSLAYWTGAGTVAHALFGTADVVLTNGAQNVGGVKTYSDGISFGDETLSVYNEATSYTPAVTGTGSNPTVSYTNQLGRYTQIGNTLFFSFYIQINTISGGSGGVRLSLPVTAAAGNANTVIGSLQTSGPDFSGTPISIGLATLPGTALMYLYTNADNGSITALPVSGLAAGDFLVGSGFYFV